MTFALGKCALLCSMAVLTVILHGCGGGGSTTTTTTTTEKTTTVITTTATTTTSTSTSSTTHKPVAPLSPGDAVKELNTNYGGWNGKYDNSALYGVTIRFLHPVHILNDKTWFYCQTKCTENADNPSDSAYADCRVSAVLMNNQTMIGNNIPFNASKPVNADPFEDLPFGVAFNQTWVEETAGKCYYQFDGSTTHRYNHGCGCGPPSEKWDCSKDDSPYGNIDPKTQKQMNSKSEDVAGCHCGDGKFVPKPMPSKTQDSQCFWKGPAFDPDADPVNELGKMMQQRVSNQHGVDVVQDKNVSRLAYQNEVVIEGNVLAEQLAVDPSKAILAVVWVKGGNSALDTKAHNYATSLANYFQKQYTFTVAPPVIGLDIHADVREQGPFFSGGSSIEDESVIFEDESVIA